MTPDHWLAGDRQLEQPDGRCLLRGDLARKWCFHPFGMKKNPLIH